MATDHQTPLDIAQSTIYGRDVLEVITSWVRCMKPGCDKTWPRDPILEVA